MGLSRGNEGRYRFCQSENVCKNAKCRHHQQQLSEYLNFCNHVTPLSDLTWEDYRKSFAIECLSLLGRCKQNALGNRSIHVPAVFWAEIFRSWAILGLNNSSYCVCESVFTQDLLLMLFSKSEWEKWVTNLITQDLVDIELQYLVIDFAWSQIESNGNRAVAFTNLETIDWWWAWCESRWDGAIVCFKSWRHDDAVGDRKIE